MPKNTRMPKRRCACSAHSVTPCTVARVFSGSLAHGGFRSMITGPSDETPLERNAELLTRSRTPWASPLLCCSKCTKNNTITYDRYHVARTLRLPLGGFSEGERPCCWTGVSGLSGVGTYGRRPRQAASVPSAITHGCGFVEKGKAVR